MKRFSKMLALGMAAAMMLGMTVNAAGSPDTESVDAAIVVDAAIKEGGIQDSEGNVVTGVDVTAEALPTDAYDDVFGNSYEEAIAKADASEAINNALQDVTNNKFGADTSYYSWIIEVSATGTMPTGGMYVSLVPVTDGAEYVVGHWNGTAWEVLQTKTENGYVYALFPEGFSPVYLAVLTLANDDNPAPSNPDDSTPPASNDSPADNGGGNTTTPVSPKTGETMPVAGILAVICLAGAAVCAKKVRCNG